MREAYVVGASSSQDGFSRYRFAFLAIFAAQSQSKPGRGPPRERPSGTPFPHPRSNVEPQLLSRNPSPRFLGPAKSHAIARKRHLKLLAHTAPRDLLLQWLERRKAMETIGRGFKEIEKVELQWLERRKAMETHMSEVERVCYCCCSGWNAERQWRQGQGYGGNVIGQVAVVGTPKGNGDVSQIV